MKLTEELKAKIDNMTYESLLSKWRNAPIGTSIFQGESGEYFTKRMAEIRSQTKHEDQVQASKNIGWEHR